MNACPMEEEVHANRYAPTLWDHLTAAVSLDTICLDLPAMVWKLCLFSVHGVLF